MHWHTTELQKSNLFATFNFHKSEIMICFKWLEVNYHRQFKAQQTENHFKLVKSFMKSLFDILSNCTLLIVELFYILILHVLFNNHSSETPHKKWTFVVVFLRLAVFLKKLCVIAKLHDLCLSKEQIVPFLSVRRLVYCYPVQHYP